MLGSTDPERRARTDPLGCSAKHRHSGYAECRLRGVYGVAQYVHKYKEQTLPLTITSIHICVSENLFGDAYSFHVYL